MEFISYKGLKKKSSILLKYIIINKDIFLQILIIKDIKKAIMQALILV